MTATDRTSDTAVEIDGPSQEQGDNPLATLEDSDNMALQEVGKEGQGEEDTGEEGMGEELAQTATGQPLDRVPSQAQKLGRKKVMVIMTALCLVVFLAALDMTIVSTALPTMASHFNATESGYSWMASSYLLANAACIPLWGKVSDIWGRKPVILAANLIFLVGSLVSGLADNLAMIISGRAVQGVGGGGIIILANICVTDLFSVRDRPLYYALFGATWAIASALGPIIGGAFTTDVTWRWCFYLNLPIGGFSFVVLFILLKVESEKVPLLAGLRSIDWTGTLLIVGGTLMFLFGLEFGGVNYPWASATVICLIVFGLVTLALGMVNEWKFAKYPVIPTRLFTNWHNVLILLVCFCHGFVFIAGTYYLPLYFQTVLLASPILSGVYILPLVLFLSLLSIATGIIIRKTGRYREVIIFGMAFMTLGFGLFIILKPYAAWARIVLFQFIAGAGVGPIFQAPLVAFQANIHPSDMATATATFGFIRQLSASMSVVLGTVVYQNVLGQRMPELVAAVGKATAEEFVDSFAGSDKDLIAALAPAARRVVLDAFTYTLSRMWIMYTVVAGLGLLFSLLVSPVELSRKHVTHKTGLQQQEMARQEILAAQRQDQRQDPSKPELDV